VAPSFDSTLLSLELPSPPGPVPAGLAVLSRLRRAEKLALALLVDLDSHPPDFLGGGCGAADWAELAGLSVPETEGGAEVEATLEAELIQGMGVAVLIECELRCCLVLYLVGGCGRSGASLVELLVGWDGQDRGGTAAGQLRLWWSQPNQSLRTRCCWEKPDGEEQDVGKR